MNSLSLHSIFHLISDICIYFSYTVNKHVNTSVYHMTKLVSNWCRAKLYDYSEKSVTEQYHFLTCIISVKNLYFS